MDAQLFNRNFKHDRLQGLEQTYQSVDVRTNHEVKRNDVFQLGTMFIPKQRPGKSLELKGRTQTQNKRSRLVTLSNLYFS
jgi:hypothetical protein